MRDVSVVTVLHNSAAVIADCLASVPQDAEVIVVDNASTDAGPQLALSARPQAILARSAQNLGFGGGCNLGWRRASGAYVAFINPDVRLRPGALETMVDRLGAQQHGIVGPALFDAAGTARRCNARPSPLFDLLNLLPMARRWAPVVWDGKLPPGDPTHTYGGPVAYVEGACFVLRRADLEAIGGFDEDLFLYCEEESLARRLSHLGGQAYYEPAAEADHSGGESTRRIGSAATRHFYRSRILMYRKRDGPLRGRLAAVLLAAGVLLSLPAAAANSALRRNRSLRLAQSWNVLGGLFAGSLATGRSGIGFDTPGVPPDDVSARQQLSM